MHNSGGASTPYVQSIRDQPAKLQKLLDNGLGNEAEFFLDQVRERFDGIVLTGMGSSLHSTYPLFLRLCSSDIPVWRLDASELLQYGMDLLKPNRLLWAISQSGQSAEIEAILDSLPGRHPVLGTTNDLSSPLGRCADVVIEMLAGPESGVGTASYVNSLAVNEMAATRILGQRGIEPELTVAAERLEQYLADLDAHVSVWQELEIGRKATFLLGRGPSLASARNGALVIKEAAKVPAEAMSSAQFRHGPLELAGEGLDAIVVAGDTKTVELNRNLAGEIEDLGGTVTWIGPEPGPGNFVDVPGCLGVARQIGEIVPLQLLSVAIGESRGIEPGAFQNIDGVTRTL